MCFQNLISQYFNTLNFLILDEVLDGVDKNGQFDIINQLKNIDLKILLITHQINFQNFENVSVIEVKKENKISFIE